MREFFVDLHIHIGRTYKGQAVKITASKNLTFSNIMQEASDKKGIDMIGIIDMHSPQVIEEVEGYIKNGEVIELEEGGLRYKQTTIILGSEVEIRFPECSGTAHFLTYFPNLERMKQFSSWLYTKVKNVHLSTQRLHASMDELMEQVASCEGIVIPAHVFTPFKSVYGNCTNSMSNLLDMSLIPAVELGLSSDSDMADCLSELHPKTFVTNSDAHSLPKIGREYQKIKMQDCNYQELWKALWRKDERKITANYGLNPKLGKYHLTRCAACSELIREDDGERCPYCGHSQIINGVFNRLRDIADLNTPQHPPHRPPYVHQVPLEFIPGLGPRKLKDLLDCFGTEMRVLHFVTETELAAIVGETLARLIIQNRLGIVNIEEGGGGKYGKILSH
ncbi:MAG TPA: endonuclease Q family protein [Bacillota bacterium]|nr:endonuclease Q family protein [Bacillota bacterium]